MKFGTFQRAAYRQALAGLQIEQYGDPIWSPHFLSQKFLSLSSLKPPKVQAIHEEYARMYMSYAFKGVASCIFNRVRLGGGTASGSPEPRGDNHAVVGCIADLIYNARPHNERCCEIQEPRMPTRHAEEFPVYTNQGHLVTVTEQLSSTLGLQSATTMRPFPGDSPVKSSQNWLLQLPTMGPHRQARQQKNHKAGPHPLRRFQTKSFHSVRTENRLFSVRTE